MLDVLGNGLGPSPNGTDGSGILVAFPAEVFQSPLLDLTQVTLGLEIVPARLGHIPAVIGARWIIEQKSGTQTSTASWRAGSDAGHSNLITSATTPSNADVNGAAVPAMSANVGGASVALQRFANTPCILDVTVGAAGTGGFALLARLFVSVRWGSVI